MLKYALNVTPHRRPQAYLLSSSNTADAAPRDYADRLGLPEMLSAGFRTDPAEEMKRYVAALGLLILVVVLAMGCAASGETAGGSYTTELLQSRLEQEGVSLLARGTASQPFLSHPGQEFVTSHGGALQIYEYESRIAADADRENISQFGLGLSGPAHVFHRGRIIAIFFGNDITVEQALSDALGPQISF